MAFAEMITVIPFVDILYSVFKIAVIKQFCVFFTGKTEEAGIRLFIHVKNAEVVGIGKDALMSNLKTT